MNNTNTIKPLENKNNLLKPTKIGDIVEGTIIGVGRSSVFIDLGILGAGVIYGKEFNEAKIELEKLKKGENVSAKVIDLENEDGYIELSLAKANRELVWKELRQKKENNETIKIKVLGANKGGLLTEFKRIPAFLPASQLSLTHYSQLQKADQLDLLKELQKFIGQELKVKVFEFSSSQNKIILSEKSCDLEHMGDILKDLQSGDVVEGKISKIVNFGAFIRFQLPQKETSKKEKDEENESPQEVEGLIHISELDWQLIEDPGKILEVNQIIKAKIIKIAEGRIFLSLKALKKDPWENIEKEYKKGDIVKGKALKLNTFGVLVQLPSKIQGLCHISEFDAKVKMEEVIEVGKEYNFQVLSLDAKGHKILLSPRIDKK